MSDAVETNAAVHQGWTVHSSLLAKALSGPRVSRRRLLQWLVRAMMPLAIGGMFFAPLKLTAVFAAVAFMLRSEAAAFVIASVISLIVIGLAAWLCWRISTLVRSSMRQRVLLVDELAFGIGLTAGCVVSAWLLIAAITMPIS